MIKMNKRIMQKKASPLWLDSINLISGLGEWAVPAAFGVTAAVGGIAGYLASRATSPGRVDFQTAQKKFINTSLLAHIKNNEKALKDLREKQKLEEENLNSRKTLRI